MAAVAQAPTPATTNSPTLALEPTTQATPSLGTSAGVAAPGTAALPGANNPIFPSSQTKITAKQDYAKNTFDSARIEAELIGNNDAFIKAAQDLTTSGYKKAEVIAALQSVLPFDQKNSDIKATYAAVFNAVAAIEQQSAASAGTTVTLRKENVKSPGELAQDQAKARKANAGADVAETKADVAKSKAELEKKKLEQATTAQGSHGQKEADTKVQAKTAGNQAEIARKDRSANRDEKGQSVDDARSEKDVAKNERQESKERVGWWKDKWDTAVDVYDDINKRRKK